MAEIIFDVLLKVVEVFYFWRSLFVFPGQNLASIQILVGNCYQINSYCQLGGAC